MRHLHSSRHDAHSCLCPCPTNCETQSCTYTTVRQYHTYTQSTVHQRPLRHMTWRKSITKVREKVFQPFEAGGVRIILREGKRKRGERKGREGLAPIGQRGFPCQLIMLIFPFFLIIFGQKSDVLKNKTAVNMAESCDRYFTI